MNLLPPGLETSKLLMGSEWVLRWDHEDITLRVDRVGCVEVLGNAQAALCMELATDVDHQVVWVLLQVLQARRVAQGAPSTHQVTSLVSGLLNRTSIGYI